MLSTKRPRATQAGTTLAAILALTTIGGSVLAAPFTLGNLVVSRVGVGGTGSTILTSAATAVFLDEFTTTGTLVQTLALPTTGTGAFTLSGTASSEGALTLSANPSTQAQVLTIAGYNAAAGVTGIASTTSTVAPRVVDVISADGTTITAVPQGTNFSGNNIRSAISADGTGTTIYASGASTGVVYSSTSIGSSPTVVSSTVPSERVLNIFGGDLYFSTGSGTVRGIYKAGGGLPTTTGNTSTIFIDTGASSSPYDFYFASANTVYIADDRASATATPLVPGGGGLLKYVNSGGTFTLSNTYNLAGVTSGFAGLRGLTGNGTDIFGISTDNRLVDFNIGSSGFTTLATAATNTAFRGVDASPAPEPSQVAGLGFFAFGLAGVILKARRKRSTAPVDAR